MTKTKKIFFVIMLTLFSCFWVSAKWNTWDLTVLDNTITYIPNTSIATQYVYDWENNNNNIITLPKNEGVYTYVAQQQVPYTLYTTITPYTWSRAIPWINAYINSFQEIINNNYSWQNLFLNWCNNTWTLYLWTTVFQSNAVYSYCNLNLAAYQQGLRYVYHTKLYIQDESKPTWNWIICKKLPRESDWSCIDTNFGATDYTLGTWTNQCIKCRVECVDNWVWWINTAWCAANSHTPTQYQESRTGILAKWTYIGSSVYTPYSTFLWHKSIPTVPLDDIANNWASISWANWFVQDILVDYAAPNFKKILIDWVERSTLANDISDIPLLPGNHQLYFEFWDKWDWNIWVSWIKEYSYSFTQIKDYLWNDVNNEIISHDSTRTTYWVYNSDGTITAEDIKQISINNFEVNSIWRFKLQFKWTDYTGNSSTINKYFNVVPWRPCLPWDPDAAVPPEQLTRLTLKNANWQVYADNTDYYEYDLFLRDCRWNPIYSKTISWFSFDISWYSWWKSLYLDNVSHTNTYNLNIPAVQNTDEYGNTTVKVKSITPWVFTERYKLLVQKYNDDYESLAWETFSPMFLLNTNSTENSFLKPFYSELKVSNTDGVTWNALPQIWIKQKYKLDLINPNWTFIFTNWRLNISESTIINTWTWHIWDWTFESLTNYITPSSSENTFYASINTMWDALNMPVVKTNNIYVTYEIDSKTVKYELTASTNFTDNTPSVIWDPDAIENLWLKVIWTIQWDWNSERSWQDENFSDLSKSELRHIIRENAYKLIKWMESWDVLEKVLFIEWDVSLSSIMHINFETLIVKDWNLIIDRLRYNESWFKKWFIVLKDNYDIHDWYENTWNILIDRNTRYIDAAMYADWAIISSNWDQIYEYWDFGRSWDLANQLVIYWSVFTRNTIWWTLLNENNKYRLPWWEELEAVEYNKALAFIYDLNHIRTWNVWWDWSNLPYNDWKDDTFIIKYNPDIQTDAPKWFN